MLCSRIRERETQREKEKEIFASLSLHLYINREREKESERERGSNHFKSPGSKSSTVLVYNLSIQCVAYESQTEI